VTECFGLPPSGPRTTTLPGLRSQLRGRLIAVARLVLTFAVFGYLFTRIEVPALAASLERIPTWAALASLSAQLVAVLCGVLRWRVLARSAGALYLPRWSESVRQYLVGMFYNLLPGAVGGDVLRGYETRRYFDESTAVRSVGVVFIERVCGFAGLLVLASSATLARERVNGAVLVYSAIGLSAALLAVFALAIGRRVSARLPAKLARMASSLPALENPLALLTALALSVLVHALVAATGYVVLVALTPVGFAEGMSIFPLGTLAAFFPLTIAGAGARDTALVVLLSEIGVSRADALATSLSMLACGVVVAGIGGIVQLKSKRFADPAPSP
jgi:uncharacterized protein (TIRG00374 family)